MPQSSQAAQKYNKRIASRIRDHYKETCILHEMQEGLSRLDNLVTRYADTYGNIPLELYKAYAFMAQDSIRYRLQDIQQSVETLQRARDQ